jgi:5-bromo-4-chloroindolyl phosphate hydrolysis protein
VRAKARTTLADLFTALREKLHQVIDQEIDALQREVGGE